jgi:hypothetical protein
MYESASSVALRASNAAVRASAAAGRASTRLSARTSAAAGRLSRTASGRARALSVRVSTALRRSSVRVADESGAFAEHSAVAMPGAGDAALRPAEDRAPSGTDVFTARLQVRTACSHCSVKGACCQVVDLDDKQHMQAVQCRLHACMKAKEARAACRQRRWALSATKTLFRSRFWARTAV